MGFNCGIAGLPNVGKSTLFNALTQSAAAEAANYPFCTIEPNVGRVPVPDPRLGRETIDIKGGIAKPIDPPAQCRFFARCPLADDFCRDNDHPPLEDKGGGHMVACYKV